MIMIYTCVTNTKSQIFHHRREHFKMSRKKTPKIFSLRCQQDDLQRAKLIKKLKIYYIITNH